MLLRGSSSLRLLINFLVRWPRNSMLSTQLRASSTTLTASMPSALFFSAVSTVRPLRVAEKAAAMLPLFAISLVPRFASKSTDCLLALSSAALRTLLGSTGLGRGVGGGGRQRELRKVPAEVKEVVRVVVGTGPLIGGGPASETTRPIEKISQWSGSADSDRGNHHGGRHTNLGQGNWFTHLDEGG